MKIGYLTHFHPSETVYVDLNKKAPTGGKVGILYAAVSFIFWRLAWKLHLTDWPHPRFLTDRITEPTQVVYDNVIDGRAVDCHAYEPVSDGWREIP